MVDFGIAGKTAIVCASSKGLGFGCADALAAVGVNLVMNARTADTLAQAAHTIRDRHGVHVIEVACDITTEDGRAEILAAAGHHVDDIGVHNLARGHFGATARGLERALEPWRGTLSEVAIGF